jgi:hypothetical protein
LDHFLRQVLPGRTGHALLTAPFFCTEAPRRGQHPDGDLEQKGIGDGQQPVLGQKGEPHDTKNRRGRQCAGREEHEHSAKAGCGGDRERHQNNFDHCGSDWTARR